MFAYTGTYKAERQKHLNILLWLIYSKLTHNTQVVTNISKFSLCCVWWWWILLSWLKARPSCIRMCCKWALFKCFDTCWWKLLIYSGQLMGLCVVMRGPLFYNSNTCVRLDFLKNMFLILCSPFIFLYLDFFFYIFWDFVLHLLCWIKLNRSSSLSTEKTEIFSSFGSHLSTDPKLLQPLSGKLPLLSNYSLMRHWQILGGEQTS